MADGVLDQVEQHALELLRVGLGGLQGLRNLGLDRDALGLGLHAHGLDGLADQFPQRHLLARPVDVAGLQARELEQVVDQHAERVDVGSHPAQVGPAGLRVLHDVVTNCVGEQAQRGDRRAQVVRHRGGQVAAGGLGLVPPGLLLAELVDHRVGRRGELGQLVVGRSLDRDVAPAAADRHQAVADRRHVAQDPTGHEAGGHDCEQAGTGDDRRHHDDPAA